MAQEIELKLRFARRDLPRLLAHPLLKRETARMQTLRNTYYDSAELALHQQRIAVRLREKNGSLLLTVKSSAPASGGLSVRQEWEDAATPGIFDFSLVGDPALRQFLEQQRAALRPVFSTDFQRQVWVLAQGEARIEVAIDLGWISAGKHEGKTRKERICELELELLSGGTEQLFTLCHALQRRVTLIPALPSKAERGYRLFLGTRAAPVCAPAPTLAAAEMPLAAVRRILLADLEHLQHNEAGLLGRKNPEYVHQARLALRRLRSSLAFFAPLLPADYTAHFAPRWQQLARQLGVTRDWDVLLHDTLAPIQHAFPDDPHVRSLCKQARLRAADSRKTVTRHGNSNDYGRLLIEFTAATYALALPDDTELHAFSQQRWQAWHADTQTLARHTAPGKARQLHRLRRRLKALHGTAELLHELAPKLLTPERKQLLKTLLKVLGVHNDLVVARQLLRELNDASDEPGLAQAWIAGQKTQLQQQIPALLADWPENA
ncbi:CHAD domain-containing protein [Azonexus sp.]|uniref:CYTH and CHAD domain-containing protein n=1 Tax=Azonexus sp. TaxID=1872668 RepID=UPI0039E3E5FF